MSMGSRIMLKSNWIKCSGNTAGNPAKYAKYIGTRDGAVMMADKTDNDPVTKPQEKLIEQLTHDIPKLQNTPAYIDYLADKTQGNAHNFIETSMDEYGFLLSGVSGYAKYMASRPGAVRVRDNALFCDEEGPVDLDKVAEELSNYHGNVYTPIISLREADSLKYHLDNPESWRKLIVDHRLQFAEQYHIPIENLRWIGAYHHAVNKDGVVHNHIHMLVWSKVPNQGFQTRETGNNIRKVLGRDIFKPELEAAYQEKTESRDRVRAAARSKIQDLLESGRLEKDPSDQTLKDFSVLADAVKNQKGRIVYGYMPPETKAMVDRVVDELFEDPDLKQLINQWAEAKDKQIKVFTDGKYVLPPASQIPEFKTVKNAVLTAAKQYSHDKRQMEIQLEQQKKTEENEKQNEQYQREMMVSRLKKPVRKIAKALGADAKRGAAGENHEADYARDEYENNMRQRF